jgi:uncharacterized membrane protein YqiK
MAILLLFVFGLALLFGPTVADAAGQPLGVVSSLVLSGSGIGILIVTGFVFTITRLYRKTKAYEAFVRTGSGGVKVIRDGGALIIPVLHELVRVTLQTLKLEVIREAQDALITQDKLRADIRAEFFVRVQPDAESILQASRSFGERMNDPHIVEALIEDKLVSALRTAAAMKTLEELNSERDDFLAEVMKLVAEDLKSNGLVLETATISKLDQTDEQYLKAENIFDAQGRRKIAEITQLNQTERNRLVREGEEARRQQDVATKQKLLELARKEKEAEAEQSAEIAKAETNASRAAEEKRIEAQRLIELAQVERQQALELALRRQQQAVEVAEREKLQCIAQAEKLHAAAERDLAQEEAERERARQLIETVKLTEEADRQKRCQVVDAQAKAEQNFVSEQRKADAAAYALQKQAEAQQLAADAAASAVRIQAQAEAEAMIQRAQGDKALAMVPIEVRGATASVFTKMQANFYGSAEDANKLLSSLLQGQQAAATVEGFLGGGNGKAAEAVSQIGGGIREIADAVMGHLAVRQPGDHEAT